MDLGIASPINVVHTATTGPNSSQRITALGRCVALVAASVPTKVVVSYEGSRVLAAFAPAGETSRIEIAEARGEYTIEATNWGDYPADIHITLEAVKTAVTA